MKITLYLDVISSWCFWATPAWQRLKAAYEGRVEFAWKIALMDASGLPVSAEQLAWFYRRSETLTGAEIKLSTGWFEAGRPEYVAPNAVAEAAKDFGLIDDRVRDAIARAAVIEGRKIGDLAEAVRIAVEAVPELDSTALSERAQSQEVLQRLRATTAEFHALDIDQRPAFVLENAIGDRAVLSGIVHAEPLLALVGSMLADEAVQAAYGGRFGGPPQA
ncbi:MAG: DsbA family protein [Chthoniobacteraceae bacterium]